MIRLCIAFFILPFICFGQNQSILTHSHNDYLQKEPLQTALKFQVNSIEVDVALFDDTIKVCHFPIFLKNKPDFESLYLKPMLENKDKLSSVQYLFVDIKNGGDKIIDELNTLISEYPEIFTNRDELDTNKIKVIISGNADQETLWNDSQKFLFIDGNKDYLSENYDSTLVPIISANYKSLSEEERIEFIKHAHLEDKKVRFWNTNDNAKTWKKLIDLGVDFIGVDYIEKFYKFNSK